MIQATGELFDKKPPCDLDAERALLACVMLKPALITDVMALLTQVSCFGDEGHQALYSAMRKLVREGKPIDTALIVGILRANGTLELLGGVSGLVEMYESHPTAAHWRVYADKVLAAWRKRRAFTVGWQLLQGAHTCEDTAVLVNDAISDLSQDVVIADDSKDGPAMVCLADVESVPVNWLWHGRVAAGRLTLIVGDPGLGKSFITTDMAARVSTGSPWPDGAECPKGSTILISAEDDAADTIRPRLDAHHADCSKVHLLSGALYRDADGQQERMIDLGDLDIIETALKSVPDCKLVVVDPVGSYLGGKIDPHKDSAVRSVLAPIAKLAERYGVAFVVVVHRRKGASRSADEMAMGSRAFVGLARTVWHLSKDQENPRRRLFLCGKNNLAVEGLGLAFEIGGDPARIWWEKDPVDMTADDAAAADAEPNDRRKPGPDAVSRNAAKDWLVQLLFAGAMESNKVKESATAAGYSWATIRRSQGDLGIVPAKRHFASGWWWELPAHEGAQPEQVPPGLKQHEQPEQPEQLRLSHLETNGF